MEYFVPKDDLPPGAEIGFVYDFMRQHQNQNIENKKKIVKLKKKVNRLSKKNEAIRRKS